MSVTTAEENSASAARVAQEADASTNAAQDRWATLGVGARLRVLTRTRHDLASRTADLVDAMPPMLGRNRADTLAAEVLPLLVACRFLEREAGRILKTRRLEWWGLPLWLAGVESSVERAPLGTVLVIGPSNYPLFLPGVQVLQALVAGNAAVWKPGTGGEAVAKVVAEALRTAGLPHDVLRVMDESAQAGIDEMSRGVDKVIFTGSGAAGRAVLHAAVKTITPVVAELSGCDAVVVLPSADAAQAAAAICFGMRLNGSATCMAPRRLMLIGAGHDALLSMLQQRFAAMEGVLLREPVRTLVTELTREAVNVGAIVLGDACEAQMKPLLVLRGRPEMRLVQSDVFAPVMTVMEFADVEAMLQADAACPFGLTATVFGEEREAKRVGARMKVGMVLVNDVMVASVDPRVPFGGRRESGFGVTRGAEGLLEMTTPRTVLVRHGKATWQYDPTGEHHEALFSGLAELTQGSGLRRRWAGLRTMIRAGKKIAREKA